MAGNFAVVRWLNDNNLLSVHCMKHFLEPRKDIYVPGDEGLACYPGHPGEWHFRILAVGDKKTMSKWLDKNFNRLMADVTDKELPHTVVQAQPDTAMFVMDKSGPEMSAEPSTAEPQSDHAPPAPTTSSKKTELPHTVVQAQPDTAMLEMDKSGPQMSAEPSTAEPQSDNAPPAPTTSSKKTAFTDKSGPEMCHTSESSKRRENKLEEEVKSLRKKVRRLEERVSALEENRQSAVTSCKTDDEIALDLVRHLGEEDVNSVLQIIARHLFTSDELRNSSRTGKRTVKCGASARPPLDTNKFNTLERLVLTKTKITKDAFFKKFENFQKVLRRK